MDKTLNTPSNSLHKSESKDSSFPNQLQTIFQYLKVNIATASMVSDATKVPQKNICRYKRDLEKAGQLWEVSKAYCKKTGFKAWYLTTDERKAPVCAIQQLKLF
jgi:hypothetical protein